VKQQHRRRTLDIGRQEQDPRDHLPDERDGVGGKNDALDRDNCEVHR
jgi:hypothetical protein